jgi:hypothetical protein
MKTVCSCYSFMLEITLSIGMVNPIIYLYRLRKFYTEHRPLSEAYLLYTYDISAPSSAFGIATGYGLDNRGVRVRVPVRSRILSSPCRPDRLWGPSSYLSNGYRGLFPRGQSGRSVKLTIHLQLMPRSRKCGSIYPLPLAPSWRSA